jgi:hypothetical protein
MPSPSKAIVIMPASLARGGGVAQDPQKHATPRLGRTVAMSVKI